MAAPDLNRRNPERSPSIVVAIEPDRRWVEQAVCKGKTDLFFAPPGERSQRRARREALAESYCMQCTVLVSCRSWARENRESGFWGGESDEARAAAGYPPRSPNRRAVAEAGRRARRATDDHGDPPVPT